MSILFINVGGAYVPYYSSDNAIEWKMRTSNCSGSYSYDDNCEFVSGDILELGVVSVSTIRECASACVADVKCLYFDVTPLASRELIFNCLLMTNRNTIAPVIPKVSSVAQCGHITGRSPPVFVAGINWKMGVAKCSGNYFYSANCELVTVSGLRTVGIGTLPNLEGCASTCLSDPKCRYFSLTHLSNFISNVICITYAPAITNSFVQPNPNLFGSCGYVPK
jgi:hypothetical protein